MHTERKDGFFGRRLSLSEESECTECALKKERKDMSNNSNRINIPQAKQAMDQFKMQGAQDEDVPATS